MTTVEGGQQESMPESAWTIRPELIEAQGKSAVAMVADRLCDACRAGLEGGPAHSGLKFSEVRAKLQKHCGEQEGYLHSHRPVQETAVRILLASNDLAMRLSVLHRRIIDLWSSSTWPRHIAAPALERVLEHGQEGGIDRVTV